MRAQLRTYHSIPSLQAHQDPNAYKQLQDAPRLKSILKGATEDVEQPSSLEDIRGASIPRTNPVNLIFVLAQFAPKISEMHFDVPRDFFDLVMKSGLSSRSRATAFLWLMWWYLESDFSTKDALANPYGPGRRSRDADEREMPIKCPQFEYLTDEQALLENVDTQEEIDFGELKRKERVAILATDLAPVITGPKRSSKKAYNQGVGVFSMASDNDTASPQREYNSPAPSQGLGRSGAKPFKAASSIKTDDQYDTDRTRSVSPTGSIIALHIPPKQAAGMRINTILNDDAPTPPPVSVAAAPIAPTPPASTLPPIPTPAATSTPGKGPGRGNWGHRRKENQANIAINASSGRSLAKAQQQASEEPDSSQIAGSRPHGFYLPLNGAVVEPKRSRPLTSHQLAVERYRKERVDFIIDRGLRNSHIQAKRKRVKEGSVLRAWRRSKALPDGWDSEEEDLSESVPAREGVAARALLMMSSLRPTQWEQGDWGEEASSLASGMRRVRRRTERWETGEPVVRKKHDLMQEQELDADGLPTLAPMESTEGIDAEDDGVRESSPPLGMEYENDEELEAEERREQMYEDDEVERTWR
jgi:Ino eighty subunit 1